MSVRELEVVADPAEPIIVTRRLIRAARSLVFDALTRPEYLKRWMGPRSHPMIRCECDLRVRGQYRFVHCAPAGEETALHGTFREVVRPARIVRTFVSDATPDHEAVETLLLEDEDGGTTLRTITVHPTLAARDVHLAGGRMEAGMAEGYARLDALLAPLRRRADVEAR